MCPLKRGVCLIGQQKFATANTAGGITPNYRNNSDQRQTCAGYGVETSLHASSYFDETVFAIAWHRNKILF
jgi:hypothetical protein